MKLLSENEQFEIRPMDVHGHLWGAFDHYETEVSAMYITRLCYQRGNWHPFTLADIEAVYQAAGHHDGFTFNALAEPVTRWTSRGAEAHGGGWIAHMDGRYYITEEFVRRVHEATVINDR